MAAVDENHDNTSFAAVSSAVDDGGNNRKSGHKLLCWMWLAAVPLSWVGVIVTWSSYSPLSPERGIMDNLSMLAPLLPSALATLVSKIIGCTAIWRKWRGEMWENQLPLLQAAGIFTLSFIIGWCLLVVGVALGAVPVPEQFDFFLLEWAVTAIFHLYFGLSVCFVLFAIPALIPPIILCTLIIYNKKVSLRTIRILTAVSTCGWMIISFMGMLMSAA